MLHSGSHERLNSLQNHVKAVNRGFRRRGKFPYPAGSEAFSGPDCSVNMSIAGDQHNRFAGLKEPCDVDGGGGGARPFFGRDEVSPHTAFRTEFKFGIRSRTAMLVRAADSNYQRHRYNKYYIQYESLTALYIERMFCGGTSGRMLCS